ncbi:MAG: sulfatase-like hydrolase/transferase, partial [Chloroflexi bacterium]|nr:sulfatase-like hydrolase/transferase [Chloroflexota bacterium]
KLSRRDFLKAAALLGGALTVGGVLRGVYNRLGRNFQPSRAKAYLEGIQSSPTPEALPNIIIILCDDLGFGDLESPAVKTPNLKRMATEGRILNSFYASASVCSPSRAGLLTGRYPVRTLISTPLLSTYDAMNIVMDVLGRYSYNVRGIPKDEILLPEVLSRRGYRTGLVGKWHLGGTPGYLPNDRGFDSFYGALWSNDDPPYAIYRDRQMVVPAPADQNVLTHDFTVAAQDFIRSNKDGPFFLYLAHAMPHYPVHASEDFRGKSEAGLYGDAVEEIDWSVDQVFNTLKELGLDEKTLVIFSSDNGPWMQGNPGYARGRKLLWFEGGFRVPFIARWPGVIPPGTTNPEVGINFDLFATCLQMAGVNPPQDRIIDGKDILPLLNGEAASPHDTFFYYDVRKPVAVRYQHWKYLRRHGTDNAAYWPTQQGPFLFDLDTDPNESYSLIESQPERAEELARMLDAFEAEVRSNLRGWL